ncbi:MAG TPA: hypothetical protein VFL94_08265 [Actinomycetales bacterium]|nr:hypothetical protein [Actinomycetales bacterium]
MAVKKRWKDLSEKQRRMIIIGVVIEGMVKLAALRDLKRRPADQVRGPKWLWGGVIVAANSAGLVPAGYFLFGRRRSAERGPA